MLYSRYRSGMRERICGHPYNLAHRECRCRPVKVTFFLFPSSRCQISRGRYSCFLLSSRFYSKISVRNEICAPADQRGIGNSFCKLSASLKPQGSVQSCMQLYVCSCRQMQEIPRGWFASVSPIIPALLKSNPLSSCLQASHSMTPLRSS